LDSSASESSSLPGMGICLLKGLSSFVLCLIFLGLYLSLAKV
jgi:hypothetical protein